MLNFVICILLLDGVVMRIIDYYYEYYLFQNILYSDKFLSFDDDEWFYIIPLFPKDFICPLPDTCDI